jgi:hypothetical protein
MLLYITHTTTYHYVPQVNTAQHMAHLLPRDSATQSVHQAELHITPTPAATSTQQPHFLLAARGARHTQHHGQKHG